VNRGYFIAFEGGEGSGKSTQIKNLEASLKKEGLKVLVTFEPGGTPLGQSIREILLKNSNDPMCARAEALLYAASRAEHVEKVIKPALKRGEIVLCDRYMDASLAYQGVARKLGLRSILDLNLWATQDLLADQIFLFDLKPAEGLARAKNRQELDRLEAEPISFHEDVIRAYRELAKKNPSRYVVLDASQKPDEISALITQKVRSWILNPQIHST
jgi:dTMP kinase